MELLKKRPIAILIMIAVMALSILIGGRRSLAAERARVEALFYAAPDNSISIQSDLEYIGATANNLKTVALRYISADDPYIVQLNTLRTTLDHAKTTEEKYDAATELFFVVEALYIHLDPDAFRMNSTDKSFRNSLYEDIRSAMKRMEENEYNEEARAFNEMLGTPLTGAIASFTGIREVPIFG